MNHITLADEHVLMGHYEFTLFGLVSIGLFGLLGTVNCPAHGGAGLVSELGLCPSIGGTSVSG
ncbi:uncharacterized protein Nmag_4127 (plasmid) [Natrialba magadii ATCC 43099]|uniref:Uncharacterized protein n=1 Tax=Natrialba magadii (strain ATCC 43099 / DSM 3394 / CCM 3739 / CIP 104546 / IAM 13178 / JCM 8861 / NBRC 102185 / NCIMB 2190 / MS3) TaxID=547559 RepID=D3T237_NATMM|nr:hypothetical protein [Natrialba magadii]ADD07646.1 uncharacterized protein Nmag_4127 [Natrialba magadii ATCC 43099]ELY27126.1 hypothetical protein C500_14850 [Natrialba magadii ATCC 43099]